MHFPYPQKPLILFFTSFAFLFCILYSSGSVAQSAETPKSAKSDWRSGVKRMYMFTDVNEQQEKHIDYTSQGKFSLHSSADKSVIFEGQDIAPARIALRQNNRVAYIIDPVNPSRSVKKEAVSAARPEIAVSKKSFSVFPNPIDNSQREITLGLDDFEDGKEIKMSLFDMQGHVISQQSFTPKDKQHEIAIPTLPSGMYFIKINEKNIQYSKKLLVR